MRIGFWLYTIIFISSFSYSGGDVRIENKYHQFFRLPVLPSSYFPVNSDKIMIYDSDFGETRLDQTREGELDVFTFKGDEFTYRQKLLVNESGVYVKETYQKMKLLLFITKEGKFTYNEPLPRIKFPLETGSNWNWEGKEFENEEVNAITLSAKVEKQELIEVPAGNFETIKIVTQIKSSTGTNSIVTEWFAKDIGLIKMSAVINGNGLAGTARDLLGLGEIVFNLKEIKLSKD